MRANIKTYYWRKPLPTEKLDWEAVLVGHKGECPMGFGATEEEAINQLLGILEEKGIDIVNTI